MNLRITVTLAVALCLAACGQSSGSVDAALDSPVTDAPVEPDAPPLGVACEALGGTCVSGRWASCPDGTEPVPDVHSDCQPEEGWRGYFCCTPAETTTCRSDLNGNCFVGECPPCWGPTGDEQSCQADRQCCSYICLD